MSLAMSSSSRPSVLSESRNFMTALIWSDLEGRGKVRLFAEGYDLLHDLVASDSLQVDFVDVGVPVGRLGLIVGVAPRVTQGAERRGLLLQRIGRPRHIDHVFLDALDNDVMSVSERLPGGVCLDEPDRIS